MAAVRAKPGSSRGCTRAGWPWDDPFCMHRETDCTHMVIALVAIRRSRRDVMLKATITVGWCARMPATWIQYCALMLLLTGKDVELFDETLRRLVLTCSLCSRLRHRTLLPIEHWRINTPLVRFSRHDLSY